MRTAQWCFAMIALASFGSLALDAGSISGVAGIGSATIQLTGTETLTTTSNSQGFFQFYRLMPGTYWVTPVRSGYVFRPSKIQVVLFDNNNNNESVGSVKFSAVAVGAAQSTTSAPPAPESPPAPQQPATPVETSLTASPADITLTSAGAAIQLTVQAGYSDGSAQNVTASATYASNNSSVVTVSQTGLVTAIAKGAATIVASYGGMSASVPVDVNIATPTFSISGSAGVGSASVSLSGASSATTIASSSGAFSFSGLAAGTYTITPSLSGYGFTPTSQTATVTKANITGLSFTATSTVSHLVDLTWAAGTIKNPAAGQTIVGYNVYRGTVSGGPYTKLNSSPVAGQTYTDSAVTAGQTLYYVCATVDNLGDVSAYSNQASATVPTP